MLQLLRFSDHDLSGIVRKMHVQKFPPKTIFMRDFSKYNKEAFKDDLQEIDWVEVFPAGGINERINDGWNLFKQKLTAVIDRHAPFVERRKRGCSCTWLTEEIKQKMHKRDYHLRKARQSCSEREWSAYKRLRNAVMKEIRQSKANSCRMMFRDNIEKPKDFWKQIKQSYPSNKKVQHLVCSMLKVNLCLIKRRYQMDSVPFSPTLGLPFKEMPLC